MNLIRIATRNSPLALWQANFVKQQLAQYHNDLNIEIIGMTTQGDEMLSRSLSTVGGKGLFLKELEISLLNKEADIAVHSMKDVPVNLPEGLEISAVCERADPRDAFVSNNYQNLYALPDGGRVGTSSFRRTSQLKYAFPNLEFVELRGNVNTRLSKLDSGDYDAIILAAAGLIRLGYKDRIKQYITAELCLPAVGQGIVGIESRTEDVEVKALLEPLHNRESWLYLAAERAMNARMQGGCQVPIAGFAEVDKGRIRMRGMVGQLDGSEILVSNKFSDSISYENAVDLGEQVATDLLRQGAGKILSSVYRASAKTKESMNQPVVVLTRQRKYLGNIKNILESLDYSPLHIPLLNIKVINQDDADMKFAELDKFTDVVFVSRNAVEVGVELLGDNIESLKKLRVLAMGPETAKQLFKYGIDAMFPDHGTGAKALLKVSQLADLKSRKILYVRGSNGLNWPVEEMQKRGAEVESLICYQPELPAESPYMIKELLEENSKIEGFFIHSAECAQHLMNLLKGYDSKLRETKIIAGSKRIAKSIKNQGWQGRVIVAESPSNKHMMLSFSKS